MNFWSTCHCSVMSAPSVSLFADDADIAKTYLAVTQTSLNNLWIRISRRIWISQRNRLSCWLVGPKGTVWWKKLRPKFSRYCPFKSSVKMQEYFNIYIYTVYLNVQTLKYSVIQHVLGTQALSLIRFSGKKNPWDEFKDRVMYSTAALLRAKAPNRGNNSPH